MITPVFLGSGMVICATTPPFPNSLLLVLASSARRTPHFPCYFVTAIRVSTPAGVCEYCRLPPHSDKLQLSKPELLKELVVRNGQTRDSIKLFQARHIGPVPGDGLCFLCLRPDQHRPLWSGNTAVFDSRISRKIIFHFQYVPAVVAFDV